MFVLRSTMCLALMMMGESDKAICLVLKLAEPTVKSHVRAILRVLNVTNRSEAVNAVGNCGGSCR
jgi:DNA-binding NarL/FixJ family response regulator